MASAEEVKDAEAGYNLALAQINKCRPGKEGFGAEAKYGDAYQALVRVGARPQLRLKYRR